MLVCSFVVQAGVFDQDIITPEIKRISLKQVSQALDSAVFEVDVYNPNSFKLPVRELSGDIYLQNQQVAKLSATSKKSLAAMTTQRFTVPVSVNIDNLSNTVQQIVMSGQADYRFQGYMMTPVGDLPLEEKGSLTEQQIMMLIQTILTR